VGFGYWGPNLVRNLMSHPDVQVRAICDTDVARLAHAARLYPSVHGTSDITELLCDASLDLVAVSTPVSTHYPIAKLILRAGKHVLVEKPLAQNTLEAADLLSLARVSKRMIFVDHTFVFTPGVRKVQELVSNGELGPLLYYDSTRVNLGLFQHDIDVVWDLAPHDLSILDFLLGGRLPNSVSCFGAAHYSRFADMAYLYMSYGDNFVAHINVNWISPVKIRQVLLCGTRKMIVYDENTVQEKVRVYDRGVEAKRPEDIYNRLIEYREGDMFAPRIGTGEALMAEVDDIVAALRGEKEPTVGAAAGLRIVTVLEAASESMRSNGRPIAIDPPDYR